MQRALKTALNRLIAAGQDAIDISKQMPSISEAKDVALCLFNMVPARTPLTHVTKSGEPFIPSLKSTYDIDTSPAAPQLWEMYELNVVKGKILTQMSQVFLENKLDIIVGPAYQSCAVPHHTYGVATYTVFCNFFNVRQIRSRILILS